MAIESDQCFKGIGALAFVFTGLLLKDSYWLRDKNIQEVSFRNWRTALPDTSSKRCSYCDLICRVRVHSTGNEYGK